MHFFLLFLVYFVLSWFTQTASISALSSIILRIQFWKQSLNVGTILDAIKNLKILKLNNDIFGAYICDSFIEYIDTGQFPSILKQADISPVFKREFKGSKENYRAYSPGNIQVIGKAHL